MARLTTVIQGSKPKTVSSTPLSYSGRQPKAGGIQSCKRGGDSPSGCRGSHTNPGADLDPGKPSHTQARAKQPPPVVSQLHVAGQSTEPQFGTDTLQTHLLPSILSLHLGLVPGPWSPHLDCCKDPPLQGAPSIHPPDPRNVAAGMIFIKHTSDLDTPLRVTHQGSTCLQEKV